MDSLDWKNTNLYEIFDLNQDCTETEIKKAYRKKALIHHPDKNPDDPKAKELFQKLSKALEILTDKKARESYDKILNAKKEKELKNKKLDAKRRKLKDDLEFREKTNQELVIDEEEKLKREIERIRKEGSKKLEEENQLLKKKLEEQRNEINNLKSSSTANESINNTIKIKLKRKKLSTEEFTENFIRNKFSNYGKIISIVKSKKSALIEFDNEDCLKKILNNCPEEFELEILNQSSSTTCSSATEKSNPNESAKPVIKELEAMPTVMKNDDDDYESYIMKRMQEAAANQKRKIDTE